jgi:2-polyprenyl-3-methyl-5-hydroxy-6-metoxy-1,4-benzoquinol methylase
MRSPELTVRAAKALMSVFEVIPASPEVCVSNLGEVFQHPIFLNGSERQRRDIMRASSTFFYENERAYAWDNYFGRDLKPLLVGAEVLDLGCFTGGRDAAWYERYGLKSLTGLELREICVEAATQFAAYKGLNARYVVGIGEAMQFPSESFDAILTFETFEHVQDLKKVLSECHRVLRPGGKLFLVFPSYFHPKSHHLGLVTTCAGIQWLFSGRTLVKAYYDILQGRGPSASWYTRSKRDLESWERCNIINGTTVRRFAQMVANGSWKVVLRSRLPIGSVGRNVSKKAGVRALSNLFRPLARLPGVEEAFLHRITYILEKE